MSQALDLDVVSEFQCGTKHNQRGIILPEREGSQPNDRSSELLISLDLIANANTDVIL